MTREFSKQVELSGFDVELISARAPRLLSPEAEMMLGGLRSPQFENGLLVKGNFSPYFIGSIPGDYPFTYGRPNTIETWSQLPASKESVILNPAQVIEAGVLENMYAQFTEGIPGVVWNEDHTSFYIDEKMITEDVKLEVYQDWLTVFGDDKSLSSSTDTEKQAVLDRYAISPVYAKGLYHLRDSKIGRNAAAVKGQMTGLISWGFKVMDSGGISPIIYNDQAYDVVSRALLLKARWQQKFLEDINPNNIFHLDEPFLAEIGSSKISLPNQNELLEMEFKYIKGNTGAHCCGPTNYKDLFAAPLKIAALDLTGSEWTGDDDNSATYANSFLSSAATDTDINGFLNRGGIIALGIVPYNSNISEEQIINHARFILNGLRERHINIDDHIDQFLITPICGAGSRTKELTSDTFSNCVKIAKKLQEEYLL